MKIEIEIPDGLHDKTAQLVADFSKAMAEKLKAAQDKYGYSNGWESPNWENDCLNALIEHVKKGDPRDVANYCAFMWHHGWRTKLK